MKAGAMVVVLLAGCTTLKTDLDAAQDSWYGARYEAVVSQWGAPTRSTVLADGRNAHTWVSVSAESWYPSISVFGGSVVGVGVGTGVLLGQSGGEPARCERTLVFNDGQVVEQSWLGQWRYCSTFRRN